MPPVRTNPPLHLTGRSHLRRSTWSQALTNHHRYDPISWQYLSPSIRPVTRSPTRSVSSPIVPMSTTSTDVGGEDAEPEDDIAFQYYYNSSPILLPPTSPAPDLNTSPSSMSTITPKRYHRTQPATPDTPTPTSRMERSTRGLQREYAMLISPAIPPCTPVPVSMDMGSDDEAGTPRAAVGMYHYVLQKFFRN